MLVYLFLYFINNFGIKPNMIIGKSKKQNLYILNIMFGKNIYMESKYTCDKGMTIGKNRKKKCMHGK